MLAELVAQVDVEPDLNLAARRDPAREDADRGREAELAEGARLELVAERSQVLCRGACEPECPVEAIFPEDALPDKWNDFVPINYAFPDAEKINSLVDTYAEEHDVHNVLPE